MVRFGFASVIVAEGVRFLVQHFVKGAQSHVAATAQNMQEPSSPSMATAMADPSGKKKLTDNIHFITLSIIFAT